MLIDYDGLTALGQYYLLPDHIAFPASAVHTVSIHINMIFIAFPDVLCPVHVLMICYVKKDRVCPCNA